jgi:phytoene synthase
MQHCQAITRRSASNLALAFVLLPRPQRDAMAALYAFCRAVDDVADEDARPVAERRAALAAWRADIARACAGEVPEFPGNREFQPFIRRFQLPFALFDELIRGCEADLEKHRYADYEELDLYCHRVASVVGLLSIRIFGLTAPAGEDYAVALGRALQLTNILRDVGNDAQRGRIYLPQSELTRFGVREEEILAGEYSDRFAQLAAAVAGRAREFYAAARRALSPEDRRRAVAAELMAAVYWRLLQRLERSPTAILFPVPQRLSRPRKLALILAAALRHHLGLPPLRYGPA